MQQVKTDAFKADYESRVAEKKLKETRLQAERDCAEMVDADIGHFKKMVQKFGSRNQPAMKLFIDREMCDEKYKDYRHWSNKMWIMILGRNQKEEPIIGEGNTISATSAQWKKYQAAFRKTGKNWTQVNAVRMKYRKHTYREDQNNRHGHSNDRPSYFALGHKTMKKMQEKTSHKEFFTYCSEHKHCCGVQHYKLPESLEEYLDQMAK